MKEPQRGREGCDSGGRESRSKDADVERTDPSGDNEQVDLAEAHPSADAEEQRDEQTGRREVGGQGRDCENLAHSVIHS